MALTVRNNSDLEKLLVFRGAGGQPFDLTGATLLMSIKADPALMPAVLHFSSADGTIDVVNASAGQIVLKKPMSEIAHIVGEFFFDIVAIWPGGRRAIMADNIIFEQGITR